MTDIHTAATIPTDRTALIASARKIITDSNGIANQYVRRDIQLEAITILKLLGASLEP